MKITKRVKDINLWDNIIIDKEQVKVVAIEPNPDLLGTDSYDVTYSNGRLTDTISLYGDMMVKQIVVN